MVQVTHSAPSHWDSSTGMDPPGRRLKDMGQRTQARSTVSRFPHRISDGQWQRKVDLESVTGCSSGLAHASYLSTSMWIHPHILLLPHFRRMSSIPPQAALLCWQARGPVLQTATSLQRRSSQCGTVGNGQHCSDEIACFPWRISRGASLALFEGTKILTNPGTPSPLSKQR